MLSLHPDAHLGSRIDPATKSISGPCRRPVYAKQAAGKRAIRGAQRVPRRSAVGRSAAAAVGRSAGRPVAVTMRSVGRVAVSVCGFSFSRADVKTPEFFSVSVDFQFKTFGTLPNLCLPENKRGEAESYTKVHFSE